MPIRNRHKKGSHLVLDDESGFVEYIEDVRQIWTGAFWHKKNFETRQPQEFVQALNDPKALIDVRNEPAFPAVENVPSVEVGETGIPTPIGPASHLFGANGIEFMIIEDDSEPFVVA